MLIRAILTKINTTEKPMANPASNGAQNEIDGKDVQPNQKNDTAKMGAAIKAISSRSSGGIIAGACFSISRSYRGLNIRRYTNTPMHPPMNTGRNIKPTDPVDI